MKGKLFREVVADERSAPGMYHRLLKTVKTKQSKRIIRGIIKDERRHFKVLKKLK